MFCFLQPICIYCCSQINTVAKSILEHILLHTNITQEVSTLSLHSGRWWYNCSKPHNPQESTRCSTVQRNAQEPSDVPEIPLVPQTCVLMMRGTKEVTTLCRCTEYNLDIPNPMLPHLTNIFEIHDFHKKPQQTWTWASAAEKTNKCASLCSISSVRTEAGRWWHKPDKALLWVVTHVCFTATARLGWELPRITQDCPTVFPL